MPEREKGYLLVEIVVPIPDEEVLKSASQVTNAHLEICSPQRVRAPLSECGGSQAVGVFLGKCNWQSPRRLGLAKEDIRQSRSEGVTSVERLPFSKLLPSESIPEQQSTHCVPMASPRACLTG